MFLWFYVFQPYCKGARQREQGHHAGTTDWVGELELNMLRITELEQLSPGCKTCWKSGQGPSSQPILTCQWCQQHPLCPSQRGGGTRDAPSPRSRVEGLLRASLCLLMWALSMGRFRQTQIKLRETAAWCSLYRFLSGSCNILCLTQSSLLWLRRRMSTDPRLAQLKLVWVVVHRHTLREKALIICSAQRFGCL